MGISDAFKKAIYLRKFLVEIGLELLENITVMCDNIGEDRDKSRISFSYEAYRH